VNLSHFQNCPPPLSVHLLTSPVPQAHLLEIFNWPKPPKLRFSYTPSAFWFKKGKLSGRIQYCNVQCKLLSRCALQLDSAERRRKYVTTQHVCSTHCHWRHQSSFSWYNRNIELFFFIRSIISCAGHVLLSASASNLFRWIVPANAQIRRSRRACRRRLQGTTVYLVPSVTFCLCSAVVTCYGNDCPPNLLTLIVFRIVECKIICRM
jgi:hypothetical protein